MGNVIVAAGLQVTRIRDDKEDSWQSLWRSAVSEFFATLIFVFIGTGSVVATKAVLGEESIPIPSLTLISLAHGFAIMTMVYSIGEISGGHINPAVTWALLVTDRISIVRAVVYWHSQFLGGIAGSAVLLSLLPPSLQSTMGCHSINPYLNTWQGLGCEVVFTFIFIFIVFSTAVSPFVGKIAPLGGGDYGPGKLTPFAVGMTIMILHCVGIPLTGASMNPARSFGPAVVHGCWEDHWVYWFGPIIGSTIAAVIAQVIFLSSPSDLTNMLVATRGVNLMGIQNALKAASNKLEVEEHNGVQMDETKPKKKKTVASLMKQEEMQIEEHIQTEQQPTETLTEQIQLAEIDTVQPEDDSLVKVRLN